MKFILSDVHGAEQALLQRLLSELNKKKSVLWLLSGGSNIAPAIRIMDKIPGELSSSLTLALIDERYGAVGHPGSNWQQLKDAGFNHKNAHTIMCLETGLSHQQTALRYRQNIAAAFLESDVSIGLLGMGADGHIAGILPYSAAVQSTDLVAAYSGLDHERITLTFPALQKLSAIYTFAFGATKQEALMQLRDESLDIETQPAQFLKRHPDAYLYNDQIGDNS
jgi:6-phosphogluconolactonase/glucosamine-6-phosphate isomerase/deaminase